VRTCARSANWPAWTRQGLSQCRQNQGEVGHITIESRRNDRAGETGEAEEARGLQLRVGERIFFKVHNEKQSVNGAGGAPPAGAGVDCGSSGWQQPALLPMLPAAFGVSGKGLYMYIYIYIYIYVYT